MTFTIEDHLRQLGVALPPPTRGAADRPVVRYTVNGVPVTLLLTRHNDETRPDRREAAQFLARYQQLLEEFSPDALIGLASTPLEPPIDWSTVVAPTESRAFVTFVHPGPHKGLLLFARLADMLGSRRPDIPILVVQSGQSGGALNTIPGIDFSKYSKSWRRLLFRNPPTTSPSRVFCSSRLSGKSPSAVSPPKR